MNLKQMICLWTGIAVIVLMGLFPPIITSHSDFLSDYYGFLPTARFNIEFGKLLIQWCMVAFVTGGLICTFKNKKSKND